MKAVLLALIAGAVACRILMPLTTPDVRAGVRLRLSATAHPRSHPRSHPLTADLTELDDWLEDYEAYQITDTLPEQAPPEHPAPDPVVVVTTSKPLHAEDEYPEVT